MSIGFKLPVPMKITGRTSSITNAFINTIIPIVTPSDQDIKLALETLGMSSNEMWCAYCGDKASEWDHLNAIVRNKKPTGYITEISNLIPSCGKCNQSKGNKIWRDWIEGDAPLSPKTRGIRELSDKIKKIEVYENKFNPVKHSFRDIVGAEKWDSYLEMNKEIHKEMYKAQDEAEEIKKIILNNLAKN
jgi:5-methylcytosine-specific restriction endonuclease McrA